MKDKYTGLADASGNGSHDMESVIGLKKSDEENLYERKRNGMAVRRGFVIPDGSSVSLIFRENRICMKPNELRLKIG